MNVYILGNPQARQTCNEKNTIDQMKNNGAWE
jgi:hypothetical protein